MKKIVVYCHGYKSSAKADKVRMLRDAGFEVIACDIPTDPEVGFKTLINFVDDFLIDNIAREDFELVFVGTSLGGWYASKAAKLYGAKSLCINPAYSPKTLIAKLDKSCDVIDKFEDAVFDELDTVLVAEDDEIIDFSDVDFGKANKVIRVPTGGHRFIGKEFEMVYTLIKEM